MTRQATLLLALGMLVVASFVVGVSGWVLLVRDRRFARTSGDRPRPEGTEGS